MSNWIGLICTQELEKEALTNDRMIETSQGESRTAILRMDHATGAAKI